MAHWWVTFADRGPACVALATEDEARALASQHGTIANMQTLPYPARPRLDDREGWGEGQVPSFCWRPSECAGRSSCPRNPCCTE